jgi:hypothetical protein
MSKIIPLLIIGILLMACAWVTASTPVPEPVETPTSSLNSACSPPSNWVIQFNRSGGFAGFNESMTLDSDGKMTVQSERPPANEERTISENQINAITELLVKACPFEVEPEKGGCADCFLYDLNIRMDDRTYNIQASDVTMTEEMQPLIGILSQLLQGTE